MNLPRVNVRTRGAGRALGLRLSLMPAGAQAPAAAARNAAAPAAKISLGDFPSAWIADPIAGASAKEFAAVLTAKGMHDDF